MKFSRRKLIIGSAVGAGVVGISPLIKLTQKSPKSAKISGKIVGATSAFGHKLRSGQFPEISHQLEKDFVIIGGGISGLAAARRIYNCGHQNFLLLDLENQTGGNSISGKNEICAYPWGAHYVPLLTKEAKAVIQLFAELGIITGYDSKNLPIYNEYYICNDPDERLYIYGAWQDGLIPAYANQEEMAEYKSFFAFIHDLKNKKGRDGKRLFAIPLDLSSQDQDWLKLDQITMKQWLEREGYKSEYLHWYIDYSCRDDYGTSYGETSAWVGLHYFAARNGVAANTGDSSVITWPEGNGWLANKLAETVNKNIVTNALAYNVSDHGNYVTVDYLDTKSGKTTRIKTKAVIMATPRFIGEKLVNSLRSKISAVGFSYAPWAIANITLAQLPKGNGAPLSWDNVVYKSDLLGYVVATHQIPQSHSLKTVITYYWPMSDNDPMESRKQALARSYEEWQQIFLTELLRIHPELEDKIENLDIWLWGHAMIRPTPGFVWGENRRAALKQNPPIFTAHSDMSGISIFEEAYTRGVTTAENLMKYLNLPYRNL